MYSWVNTGREEIEQMPRNVSHVKHRFTCPLWFGMRGISQTTPFWASLKPIYDFSQVAE
jgi:hypothetical protein